MIKKWNEALSRWSDFNRVFFLGNTYSFFYALAAFLLGNWWGWKTYMTMWVMVNVLLYICVWIKYILKKRKESVREITTKKLMKQVGIYAVVAVCAFGVFVGMEQIYVRKQIYKATNINTSKYSISVEVDDGTKNKKKEMKLSDTQKEELFALLKKEAGFSKIVEDDQLGEEVTKENKCYIICMEKGNDFGYFFLYEKEDGNWLMDSMGRIGIGDMNKTKAYVKNLFQEK